MSEHLFDPAPYTYTYDPTSPCKDCGVATTPKVAKGTPEVGSWELLHGPRRRLERRGHDARVLVRRLSRTPT